MSEALSISQFSIASISKQPQPNNPPVGEVYLYYDETSGLLSTIDNAGNIERISGGLTSVISIFGRVGVVTAQSGDYSIAEITGGAPLDSPAFTGNPSLPTGTVGVKQAALDNSTKLSTTSYADSAVGVETARAEAAEALLAPLASPTFSGTPAAPTAVDPGANTTQLATTAFTQTAIRLSMATVPLNLANATSTVSFAGVGSGAAVVYLASGAITSILTWSGGTGYQVGDVITPQAGNFDAMILVTAVTGGAPTAGTILYGGSGYSAGGSAAFEGAVSVGFTFILSGILPGNVTILTSFGTYLTQSNQWIFINNATGAHTVTVAQGNASGVAAGGTTVVVPQGAGSTRSISVQSDGELNVSLVGCVDARDLLNGVSGTGVIALVNAPSFTDTVNITPSLDTNHGLILNAHTASQSASMIAFRGPTSGVLCDIFFDDSTNATSGQLKITVNNGDSSESFVFDPSGISVFGGSLSVGGTVTTGRFVSTDSNRHRSTYGRVDHAGGEPELFPVDWQDMGCSRCDWKHHACWRRFYYTHLYDGSNPACSRRNER